MRSEEVEHLVYQHIDQGFPPWLPSEWAQEAPFIIARSVGHRHARIIAAVKRLDLPPYYRIERRDPLYGRVYVDVDGSQHAGVHPYKHPDPPGTHDFEEAVRLAESVLDGTAALGPVQHKGPGLIRRR